MSSRKEIAAHSTSATLKNLVEATIRNAENILINLSKNGEPIPKSTPKSTKPCAKKMDSIFCMEKQQNTLGESKACAHPHVLETKFSVSRCRTLSVTSCENLPQLSARSSYVNYGHREKKSGSLSQLPPANSKAKIVPGSMRITEIMTVTGINVNFSVTVTEGNAEAKHIPVCIECPNFQPKRICFNGEWREILDS